MQSPPNEVFNKSDSSPFISWKGKSLQQIITVIKKNDTKNISLTGTDINKTFFLPNPLNIYRRELNLSDSSFCNTRFSTTINEIDLPNGTVLNSTKYSNGLVTLINPKTPEYQMENPQYNVCRYDDDTDVFVPVTNIQANALRRLRSSGKIKNTYFTDTNQYLHKRSKTFQQNQFHYQSQTTTDPSLCDTRNLQNVYKNSNEQFETQGSVTSSSRVSRLKYNTISSQEDYGNLLYYGSNYNGYNIKLKNKSGFLMTKTPTFCVT